MTGLKHRGLIVLIGTRRVRIVNRDALGEADGNADVPVHLPFHKARPCHAS
jgi:hypothetical protein